MRGVPGWPKAGTRSCACHRVTGFMPAAPPKTPQLCGEGRGGGPGLQGRGGLGTRGPPPPPPARSHPGRRTDEGEGACARGHRPQLPAPGHRARGCLSPEVRHELPPPRSAWALGPWAGSRADWTWEPGAQSEDGTAPAGRPLLRATGSQLFPEGPTSDSSLSLMEFTLICI